LKGKPEVVLFDLSKVVADHYIDRGILNLVNHEEEDAKVALAVATSANDMIKVLEDVFFTAINGKLDRQQFFQPLEDLAASRGQS
jgi:hypothetical protein